jgi:peptide deformylase
MAILEIKTYPAEILKQKARPINLLDEDIKKLAENMGETMYDKKGIGLAAPQIGYSLRLITYDLYGEKLSFEAKDILARVIQHEIDHINGILISDKVSRLKRELVLRKFKKRLSGN